MRFNTDFKDDNGIYKTMTISVLSFKNNKKKREIQVLSELIHIITKYWYTHIIYEGITQNIKNFIVELGFKGYSPWIRPFEVAPKDTSFFCYAMTIDQLKLSL